MEYMPRGPVYREKSGTVDISDKYMQRALAWRESAREKANQMQRLNAELPRINSYVRAICGDQWFGQSRARYRSRFVDNRIAKSRFDDLSQLTDTRPTIDIKTNIEAYQEIAVMLNSLMHHEWLRYNCDLSLVTTADICKAYGTGFWKMGAASPGTTSIGSCGPDQVLPIQPGFSIQESTAVLYKTWKTPAGLKRRFPFSTADIEREANTMPTYGTGTGDQTYLKPAHIDQVVWQQFSPAIQRLMSSKIATPVEPNSALFNTLEVEEYWIDDPTDNDSLQSVIVRDPYLLQDAHNWWYEVKPKKPLYPRKRLMTFVGSRLIYDGPSPFWHGLYPFPTLRLNPVFFSFWGLSKYRDLMPLNGAINEIVAGVLDLVKRVLNPTTITRDGAIASAAWKEFFPDMPGMKLKMTQGSNPKNDLTYGENPEIPGYVIELLSGWLGPEFDRMSGTVDIVAMSKKAQVPGGETIDQMRDAMGTGLKMEGRMIEIFLRDAGIQAMSNFLQFYTPEQTLKLLGEAGLPAGTFKGAQGTFMPDSNRDTHPDFWKNFALTIEPGSLHPGKDDVKKKIAIQLAMAQMISRQELYRTLDLPNGPQILKELAEENAPAPGQEQETNPEPIMPDTAGRTPRFARSERTGSPY